MWFEGMKALVIKTVFMVPSIKKGLSWMLVEGLLENYGLHCSN